MSIGFRSQLLATAFGLTFGTSPVSAAAALDAPAMAAEPAAAASAPGDIVVTATRRSESLSKVPVSVTAFTQQKMDAQGVKSVDDIARLTPGLTFTRTSGATGGTASNISIRGISSNVGASTTGIYLNDTPIQSRVLGNTDGSAYPRVFDLERVEVLRGPQGTLFGAGAEGGAVRFITPVASLSKYSAYGRTEVSTTENGAPSYEGGLAVGGPIITDTLGFRVSGWYRRDGGYIDRADSTTGLTTQKNINSQKTAVFNGSLRWQPAPGLTITPSLFYQKETAANRTQYWESLSDPGDAKFRTGSLIPEPVRDRFLLPALHIDYDAGFASIITNTSYYDRKNTLTYDYTRFNLALFTGSPYSSLITTPDKAYNRIRQKNFTQEARIQSNSNGAFGWVVGGFYSRNKQHNIQLTGGEGIDQILQTTTGRNLQARYGVPLYMGWVESALNIHSLETQKAVFGEVSFKPTSRLKLTAGGRYAINDFDFNVIRDGPVARGHSETGGTQHEKPFTPKVGLNYQLNADNFFYFNAAKGFRTGGAQAPVNALCDAQLATIGYTQSPSSYKSDSVWSYEVGAKNSLFGGIVRLDSSAYRINWKDIQQRVTLSTCGSNFIANLGNATAMGFDIAAQIRPVRALQLSAAFSYNHTTFDKTIIANRTTAGTSYFAQEDDRIGGPPVSIILGGQYDFDVLNHDAYFRMDYQHRSKGPDKDPLIVGYDATLPRTPSTDFVSARVGTTFDGWNASVFVDNLFDNHAGLFRNHDTAASVLYYNVSFRPRTVGLTVTKRY